MTAYEKVAEAIRLLAEADTEMREQLGAKFRPTGDALSAAMRARRNMKAPEMVA